MLLDSGDNGKLLTMIYKLLCKALTGGIILMNLDPRTKVLSSDEETVEVIEVIEDCQDYSDLDTDTTFEFNYDEF